MFFDNKNILALQFLQRIEFRFEIKKNVRGHLIFEVLFILAKIHCFKFKYELLKTFLSLIILQITNYFQFAYYHRFTDK